MTNLTPQAEEVLIKRLVSLNLNDTQFNSLARSIGVAPLDIFSSQFTNLQKAEALVTKANQLGIHYNLENEIDNNLFKTYNSKSVSTLFDNHLAYDFGLLYRDLLHSLETTQDTQTYDNKFFHHLEFKAKLKFKAKFKPSTRKTAIIYKNDNSVLQRKAQKLGFHSYHEIDLKVSQLYQEVLADYPVEQFPAEKRLSVLLDRLYGSLSQNQINKNTINYLYGIIFGTTAQCLIFNE